MTDGVKRGDHEHVNASREEFREGLLPKSVLVAERVAIRERREHIKRSGGRDRIGAPLTGLALSGGGIRSASFGLGALQALHDFSGIEGIDYLSTVSGGGYIGCSLTAAMQKTGGKFPFTNDDSVRHIRDYSNYLAPFGALDIVPSLGIILRGLVSNVLFILPIVLFFVWITLITYPTVESLSEPRLLVWSLPDVAIALGLPISSPLWKLHGYWFTVFLAGATIFFLIVWALVKSWQSGSARQSTPGSTEVGGHFVTVWRVFFLAMLIRVQTH